MVTVRFAVFTSVYVLLCAPVARAEEAWKTVTLGGNADFTISVPAAAEVSVPKAGEPDALPSFYLGTDEFGDMLCVATRNDYPSGASQATMAAVLTGARRAGFCDRSGATVSALDVFTSVAFDHAGMQAASCTASYTDSADKTPGHVESVMTIAAPGAIYGLTCQVMDADQRDAELSWTYFWEEIVRRVQDGFHVPK